MVLEARNIDYISSHTTIPVPRIHNLFLEGEMFILTMEYIDGVELGRIWNKMSEEQQAAVLDELRGYISQLRALTPPRPGAIEAVDGTSIEDPWLNTVGPYDDIIPFHNILGLNYIREKRLPAGKYEEYEAAVERCYERSSRREYSTRFAHGDLAPRNILINPRTFRIAAIIDWAFSGWLPEYWEYTQTYEANFCQPHWWERLRDHVLDPYPDELQARLAIDQVFERV